MADQSNPIQSALVKQPELLTLTGLSRSTLYELVARGEFPKPIKQGGGRINYWPRAAVEKYINELVGTAEAA